MNIKLYKSPRDAWDDFNKQFKPGDLLRITSKTKPLTVYYAFLLEKATYNSSESRLKINIANLFVDGENTNGIKRELEITTVTINSYKIEKCEEFGDFINDYNDITRNLIDIQKEKIKQIKNNIYDMNINSKRVKTDFNSLKNDVDEYIKIRKR